MTLRLCVLRCAPNGAQRFRVRPTPAFRPGLLTDIRPACRLKLLTPRCFESPEPPEDEEGDWEEFDPTPLESWILDDFEWDIEQPYPERGDYWDDSLDGEWDVAGGAVISNDEVRMTNQ